jgi:hypothetical protein
VCQRLSLPFVPRSARSDERSTGTLSSAIPSNAPDRTSASTISSGAFSVERRYRGPTNVLEMTFLAHGGQVRAIDLMPVHQRTAHRQGYDVGAGHRLLRHLECLEGEVELTLEFKPTFDYSRAHTNCDPRAGREAIAHAGARHLTLACDGVQAHGRITVSALSRPRPW